MLNSGKIWFDNKLIKWEDAKIHVLSHVIHYGSGAFEGLRAYEINGKSYIFRLDKHIKRLLDTCKIYLIDSPYSAKVIKNAINKTILSNNLTSCYIRPLIFRGLGELGINPLKSPVHVMIAAWSWGTYLGKEALKKGVRVCTSSWSRQASNTNPSLAKACGNYLSSQLIKLEAIKNGYDEGIALNKEGFVSEGSGENIFLIKDGILYTPDISSAILSGITRDSIIQISRELLSIKVVETRINREMLYLADEIFLTGTAAEITPVISVDQYPVGSHYTSEKLVKTKRGKITQSIQNTFFEIIKNRKKDCFDWMSEVI